MRKHIYIFILLVCALVGCRPHDILSRREMQAVLVDLHRTEAIIQAAGYNSYAYTEEEAKVYYMMLEKHGLTQAQFDSSLVWYTKHPQLFDKIYPKVTAQLVAERDAFKSLHPQNKEEKKIVRVLPDLDKILYICIDGMPIEWFNSGQKYKKMQKNEEKFVYVKINL